MYLHPTLNTSIYLSEQQVAIIYFLWGSCTYKKKLVLLSNFVDFITSKQKKRKKKEKRLFCVKGALEVSRIAIKQSKKTNGG